MTDDTLSKVRKQRDEYKEKYERLRYYLRGINSYDMRVQEIIKKNKNIRDAWNEFTVLYNLLTDDDLITMAKNKVPTYREYTSEVQKCQTCGKNHNAGEVIFV